MVCEGHDMYTQCIALVSAGINFALFSIDQPSTEFVVTSGTVHATLAIQLYNTQTRDATMSYIRNILRSVPIYSVLMLSLIML